MNNKGLSENTVSWLKTLTNKERKNHLSYIVGDLSQELEQASYNDDSILTHVLFETAEEEIKNLPDMIIKSLETQYPNVRPIHTLGNVLLHLVKELKLWPTNWLSPVPLHQLSDEYKEIFMKSGYKHLLAGNKAETSFKELVADMQGFAPIHVRDIIIETLKNITHQSFGDKNIFESPLIDPNGRVQYKRYVVENQMSEHIWDSWVEYSYVYEPYFNGLIVPLISPKWNVGSKARLVIGVTDALPVSQISIQFYVDNVDKWVTVPCKTNTVKETIMNLFPQE